MGKISNYARVLVAKLQDVFVVDQTDNNVTTTKSVTVEQIGDAICGEQVHASLKTDNQTIIGGINELAKDKNIADEYDDTHTYNTGDVTIYGNTLYICQDDNVTGDFDPTKWIATTVQSLIGDLNGTTLPLTTNPADGTVSDAIGDLSDLTTTNNDSLVEAVNEVNTRAVTITPSTGVTLNYSSMGVNGKLVVCSLITKATFTAGTWKEIGYISKAPTDEVKVPCVNNSTGIHAGMARIETTGKVSVYPISAGEFAVDFSIAYITT